MERGGREKGREGGREGGSEEWRERGREGGKEGGRERGRQGYLEVPHISPQGTQKIVIATSKISRSFLDVFPLFQSAVL